MECMSSARGPGRGESLPRVGCASLAHVVVLEREARLESLARGVRDVHVFILLESLECRQHLVRERGATEVRRGAVQRFAEDEAQVGHGVSPQVERLWEQLLLEWRATGEAGGPAPPPTTPRRRFSKGGEYAGPTTPLSDRRLKDYAWVR